MFRRNYLLNILAYSIAFFVSFNCAFGQEVRNSLAQASTLETIQKRGVLKVGLSTFVPWVMKDKKGKLVGYQVDLSEKLAEDMGVKVQFIPTAWDGIIPALLSGKFDAIIGGMHITPKRNLKVNFTRPTRYAGISILANKKLAGSFTSIKDFNKSSITIVTRRGTIPADIAKKLMPKAQHRYFDDEAQAEQEVINGNAHATLQSEPQPSFNIVLYPDVLFKPINELFGKGPESIAIKKGDPDFLNFLNNWLLLRENDGFLEESHQYWFEGRDWAPSVGLKK